MSIRSVLYWLSAALLLSTAAVAAFVILETKKEIALGNSLKFRGAVVAYERSSAFQPLRVVFVSFENGDTTASEDFSDEVFQTLSRLEHVKILDLSNTTITTSNLKQYSWPTTLEWLSLRNTKIDNSVLPEIRNAKSLKRIDLAGTDIPPSEQLTIVLEIRTRRIGM